CFAQLLLQSCEATTLEEVNHLKGTYLRQRCRQSNEQSLVVVRRPTPALRGLEYRDSLPLGHATNQWCKPRSYSQFFATLSPLSRAVCLTLVLIRWRNDPFRHYSCRLPQPSVRTSARRYFPDVTDPSTKSGGCMWHHLPFLLSYNPST